LSRASDQAAIHYKKAKALLEYADTMAEKMDLTQASSIQTASQLATAHLAATEIILKYDYLAAH